MPKRFILIAVAALALLTLSSGACTAAVNNSGNTGEPSQESQLWPAIQPYQTGYLPVSDIHKIFYQLGGNPKAQPVMVLHGGPGAGCTPAYFQYFNPEKFHVILHDQRGCGRSLPYGELKENTTQHLVADIEKLRLHLKLGPVIVFGGSWGSTLALAYAETYPQNVSGMIIRGIFTATRQEIDHFYHGGTALYFPENYEKLTSVLEDPEKGNIPAQLLEKLKSPDPAIRDKYARAWAWYESKLAFLQMPDKNIEQHLKNWQPYAFALLENHYMANNCFLAEGQLIDHIDKLKDIPVTIINGRYDVICPPITAYRLHQKLPKSRLIIAERSGHASIEPDIIGQLVRAVKGFEK